MNARERLIESLDGLEPEAILWLYDMALGLRRQMREPARVTSRRTAIERSKVALAGMRGSLSEEVVRAREDRI